MSRSLLLLFGLVVTCLHQVISTKPSVVIVGAGAAGIAAGVRLLENSIANITILEAENRIGGRIHTVEFGDGVVEMGAEFCDGIDDNIVYDLAKDLDVLDPKTSFNTGVPKLYYSNGSTIDQSLSENIEKLIGNYLVEICNEPDGRSVEDGFLNKYKSQVQDQYSGDAEKKKIAKEALRLAEDVILTLEGTSSWKQPSARKHSRQCNNLVLLNWKDKGFKILFDILGKTYPTLGEKLILNKKVSKISWSNQAVTVQTSDSSIFTADHVILTPSLGVLKEQKRTLFEPPLPPEKLENFERMGYGGMMKIFLYFPTKWWKNEDNLFFLLWSEDDLAREDDAWRSHISILLQVPNSPNVLAAWIGTDLVPEVETFSEEKLLSGCNYVIKRFLGTDYHVTPAEKLLRTTWYSNSNFRGAFSYEKKEHFHRNVFHQEKLAEPLRTSNGEPLVLFAGEATSARHYGTVQGAIESGRREADRIIKLHNR